MNQYGLLKLGGSDFHGLEGHQDSDLGSVLLPTPAIAEFFALLQTSTESIKRKNVRVAY